MRLKHILYALTLVCALAEIGMALYAMHWGEKCYANACMILHHAQGKRI